MALPGSARALGAAWKSPVLRTSHGAHGKPPPGSFPGGAARCSAAALPALPLPWSWAAWPAGPRSRPLQGEDGAHGGSRAGCAGALHAGLPSGNFPLHWTLSALQEVHAEQLVCHPACPPGIAVSWPCPAVHVGQLTAAAWQGQRSTYRHARCRTRAFSAGRATQEPAGPGQSSSCAQSRSAQRRQRRLSPAALGERELGGLEIPSEQKRGILGSSRDDPAPSPDSPVSGLGLQACFQLGSTTSPRGAHLMGNILCAWQSAEAICCSRRGGRGGLALF